MDDEGTRTRILHAATELFGKLGYGSTSVREVVEAAGVTKPVLYYHFGSKEALFLEAVHTHLDGLACLVETALARHGTVRDRSRAFVDAYIQSAKNNPDAVRLVVTAQYRPEEGQPEVDAMSVHLRKVSMLEVLIREGIEQGELRPGLDPRRAVMALIGMVNLHAMAAFHGHSLTDADVDSLLDVFFYGVAA